MVEPALWIDFQLIGLYLIGLATLAGLGAWSKRFWVWDSEDDDRLGWLRGPEGRRFCTLLGRTRATLQCSDPPGVEQCPMQSLPFRLPRIRVRQEAGLHQEAAQVQAPERCAFVVNWRLVGACKLCGWLSEASFLVPFPCLIYTHLQIRVPSTRATTCRGRTVTCSYARSLPTTCVDRPARKPRARFSTPALSPSHSHNVLILVIDLDATAMRGRKGPERRRPICSTGSHLTLQQLRRDHTGPDTSPCHAHAGRLSEPAAACSP